jgi:hypothetical protein
MTISPDGTSFFPLEGGCFIFEILFLQNCAQSVLVLKVNAQAIEEKYGWSSPQTPSSGKN